MLFCMSLPNVIQIGPSAAVIIVVSIFNMAATAAQYYFRFRICWRHCLQKVKIYWRAKSGWNDSIHGWNIISIWEKQTSRILEFYFRFWFRPFCRNSHDILHKAAKFQPYRTTQCVNMTSYRSFKMAAAAAQYESSGFLFVEVTVYRRSIIYQETKFRRHISIHSWDITTFGLGNKRLPYWNSAIGFDFDYIFVIGNRHVILHQGARFRSDRTTYCGNMTS